MPCDLGTKVRGGEREEESGLGTTPSVLREPEWRRGRSGLTSTERVVPPLRRWSEREPRRERARGMRGGSSSSTTNVSVRGLGCMSCVSRPTEDEEEEEDGGEGGTSCVGEPSASSCRGGGVSEGLATLSAPNNVDMATGEEA
mmetsp:Transcript_46990/g.102102  ORF Transcript_46990/g.102102 Transcript_46990/m.102102 type:complete len:143 (-) Transcript_46990:455-883(-)